MVGCDEIVKSFAAETAGLGSKRGTWLIQLPPKRAVDEKSIDSFVDFVKGCSDATVAIEQRNAPWFTEEGESRLIERRVARVAADPARVPGSGEPGGWRGLAYFRWHGSPRMYYSDYDRQALFSLGRRLESARLWGAETWCIFDNTAAGAALGNALEIL